MTDDLQADNIRQAVRASYAGVAQTGVTGCACSSASSSCCSAPNVADMSMQLGYSSDDVSAVPEGANMGLGCGNPHAIAALQPGEVVVDLGSGGGFDCFLAAQRVGPTGKVIGVDMTPEMISKARANAAAGGFSNVEFRLGEIEAVPVADGIVDVIISNCVINLSPEKQRVFNEAYRILKPCGRLAISDVVATQEIPAEMKGDMDLVSGCISGSSTAANNEAMLRAAGFSRVSITVNESSREFISEWAPGRNIEEYIASALIEAKK
ncbi:MAG: arsenite methyltransferase [bacterium]